MVKWSTIYPGSAVARDLTFLLLENGADKADSQETFFHQDDYTVLRRDIPRTAL